MTCGQVPADRLTLTREERIAWRRAHGPVAVSPDVERDLQQGKLEQACPDCGRAESAGDMCSWCLLPTGPDDWSRPEATEGERQALAKARSTQRAGRNVQHHAPEAPAGVSVDAQTALGL